jgi:hypothetical protein
MALQISWSHCTTITDPGYLLKPAMKSQSGEQYHVPIAVRGVWVGLEVSLDGYGKCHLYKALNPGPFIQSIVSRYTNCALLATPGYVWGDIYQQVKWHE